MATAHPRSPRPQTPRPPTPGVNAVEDAQAGLSGRDMAAHLGHDTDQGHLADVGALPSHVGARHYHGPPTLPLDRRGEGERGGRRGEGGGEERRGTEEKERKG